MKIQCPPGFQTDRPPVSAEPFWFFGINVRFRGAVPETLGLYSKLLDNTQHARVLLADGSGDFYADKDIVMVGSGQTINIVIPGSPLITLTAPMSGTSGRWWFTSTETAIIAGRANLDGLTYAIDRATLNIAPLPNAPAGAMGGGIVGGILILAGTNGVAGDGPNLVVRWSARRTDAPSSPGGPVGFEDWSPSDITASGEFLLDHGSQIIGGKETPYGFIVWTDTRTYLLEPRVDEYIFTLRTIAQRGLLAPKAFGLADGRVWWWDADRTLNVFDGGGVRQIDNPMRHASVDRLVEEEVETRCGVSTNPEYGEIMLHYPDQRLGMVELVFNYTNDAWYLFDLGRVALTDAQGERPAIGMDEQGFLFFYDLRESLAFDLTSPPFGSLPPPPDSTVEPEPFDWFLMTNQITGGSLVMQSLRSRNVSVSYTAATVDQEWTDLDEVSLALRSYGTLSLRETPTVDEVTRPLGDMLFPMRAGGKRVQLVLFGRSFRSLLRVGEIDVEVDPGGEK